MCQWTGQDVYANCVYNEAAQATVETMAAECTTWGNVALVNSNVAFAYENVHVHVDMDRDEGTSADTKVQLDWIGASTVAAALRDQHHADLVVDVFYLSGNRAAGIGYVPASFPARNQGFSSQGGVFSLVSCVSGSCVRAGTFYCQ